jgi:hypothetical protein
VVLGDDDALVVDAGDDLDDDAIACGREGMVVERLLDRCVVRGAVDAARPVWVDADVDVLSV